MFEEYAQKRVRKVLVICSSMKLFLSIVEELKKTYFLVRVSCLIPKGLNISALEKEFENIFSTVHESRFFWRDILPLRGILKSQAFDLIIVPYNSEKGYRYLNVDAFALSAQPRLALSVNINREIKVITTSTLIYKVAHRLYDLLWVGLNCLMTSTAIVFIVSAMIISMPLLNVWRIIKERVY